MSRSAAITLMSGQVLREASKHLLEQGIDDFRYPSTRTIPHGFD
jgi:hypothetical protein